MGSPKRHVHIRIIIVQLGRDWLRWIPVREGHKIVATVVHEPGFSLGYKMLMPSKKPLVVDR